MARRKLDVKQAAQVFGISTDAVHKRARRGSLESEKGEDGRVYVWIDSLENDYTQDSQSVQPLLIARLENENEFLRRELDRRAEELAEMRRIIAGLVQRVPELEPVPGPRDAPEAASEERGKGEVPPEPEKRTSWWRRLFGFENPA